MEIINLSMDEDRNMKKFLKYTLATFVVATIGFTTNADAGFFSSCTAKLGGSQNPKDLAAINKCATQDGHDNPKFVEALVNNPNCADGSVASGWEKACAAANRHHNANKKVAAAKGAAASEAKLHKELDAATKKVEKDDAVLTADGAKQENDQATRDADETKRAALEEKVNAIGGGDGASDSGDDQ